MNLARSFARRHAIPALKKQVDLVKYYMMSEKESYQRTECVVRELKAFIPTFEGTVRRFRRPSVAKETKALINILGTELPMLIACWENFSVLKQVINDCYKSMAEIAYLTPWRLALESQTLDPLKAEVEHQCRQIMPLATVSYEIIKKLIFAISCYEDAILLLVDDRKVAVESASYQLFKENFAKLEIIALLECY